MDKCAFCLKLKEMIKKGERPFDKMSDSAKDANLKNIEKNINNVSGFCRGFPLCASHVLTIKRDNKYRISKGLDIPKNLDIVRLSGGDY